MTVFVEKSSSFSCGEARARLACIVAIASCVPTLVIAEQPQAKQICLAPPSAQMPHTDGAAASAAVRDVFARYLNGPALKTVSLQAPLASQARAEARQTGCSVVLFTTVKQQAKTVAGGLLERFATGAVQQGASQVAYEAKSTGARVAASAAAGGAGNSHFAYTTKVKDQLTLEYRLEGADGAVLLERTQKRKATSDGEDLFTPMVEEAAEAIATAMTR